MDRVDLATALLLLFLLEDLADLTSPFYLFDPQHLGCLLGLAQQHLRDQSPRRYPFLALLMGLLDRQGLLDREDRVAYTLVVLGFLVCLLLLEIRVFLYAPDAHECRGYLGTLADQCYR